MKIGGHCIPMGLDSLPHSSTFRLRCQPVMGDVVAMKPDQSCRRTNRAYFATAPGMQAGFFRPVWKPT